MYENPSAAYRLPSPCWLLPLGVLLLIVAGAPEGLAGTPSSRELAGVIEARRADGFLVDSSWVLIGPGTRMRGKIRSLDQIRPGQFASVQGEWDARGRFLPTRVKVRPRVPGSSYQPGLRERGGNEVEKIEAKEGLLYGVPEVNAYVRSVGIRVVPAHARSHPAYRIRFHVLDNRHMNAFALPSGDIYIHTGLLAKVDSEDQLASVLGHEVAHVTGLHMQRHMKSAILRTSIFQVGALALGEVLDDPDSSSDRLLHSMVGLGLQMGYMAAINGYGRSLEDQADRVGLRYMREAGFNPREGPEVWKVFSLNYGDTPKMINFFYSNHSTNRVRERNQVQEIQRHYAGVPHWTDGVRAEEERTYQTGMLALIREVAVEDFKEGQKKSARSGFQKVLRLQPDDAVAREYLEKLQKP